jgi:hypothetical protein
VGDIVVLSFVDPSVARVHVAENCDADQAPKAQRSHSEVQRTKPEARKPSDRSQEPSRLQSTGGPFLAMRWTPDRIRRFVQVSDKLFTVDRLGWYRHSLALRLLLPDEVTGVDPNFSTVLDEHLQQLRSDATASLGVPLLGAFMPNFAVTPAWLESFGDGTTEQTLQVFRNEAAARFEDTAEPHEVTEDITRTPLRDACLIDGTPKSLEAALALLIPHVSAKSLLTEALTAYRNDLVDLFEQMSAAAETVRLKTMSQPNHLLDERLWQLTGTVGELFGPLAVA